MSFFLCFLWWFGCFAAGMISAGNWHFFISVMMHNHGNWRVVSIWEQLTELSEAQVIPKMRSKILII